MGNENCGCTSTGCCGSGGCGETSAPEKKKIVMDFLYLDLETCERCCSTDETLKEAIAAAEEVLDAAGVEVELNSCLIDSMEMAEKHRFLSSPTIRINGKDIDADIRESNCESCGDICGDDVDCRVWVYQGEEYTAPPKALLLNAILKEVYSPSESADQQEAAYIMPENIVKFFDALNKKSSR